MACSVPGRSLTSNHRLESDYPEVFYGFLLSVQAKAGIIHQIRPRQVLRPSFLNPYSLTILSVDAKQCKLLRNIEFSDYIHRPGTKNKQTKGNTTFRKLDLFPSSGAGKSYSVGSLRKS
jgi:hypothetical protein